MSRPKVYDERTGHPAVDNRAANANRVLDRLCRRDLRIHAGSRRRRAKLRRIEYPRYLRLVALVAASRNPTHPAAGLRLAPSHS